MKTKFFLAVAMSIISFALVGCQMENNPTENKKAKAENIIFLIGDGMGLAQIQAGLTANYGTLNLEQAQYVGLAKTSSASNYVTDSGAAGTALATGHKSYNGAIGVDKDTIPQKNMVELFSEKNYSTGVISTSSITHATPASFVAHEASRNDYENIAADFLESPVDLFIGGGLDHFMKRTDNRNIADELTENGFSVYTQLAEITGEEKKLGVLTAPMHNPKMTEGRDLMLPEAFQAAMTYFGTKNEPFFLMVEGSQIDWGGHANDIAYITAETIDFDKVVGQAIDFAKKDGKTLVVVTADHETGGLTVNKGSYETGEVDAKFTTKSHTGIMVPVFAYGPGAENFAGIYENTEIYRKMADFIAD